MENVNKMENVNNKIKLVMSTVFEVSIDLIDEDCSIDSLDNWDSIGQLNLILALEDELGISIPDEEVVNMVNYKLIKLIVNELLG
jgi:acyl carrier protein